MTCAILEPGLLTTTDAAPMQSIVVTRATTPEWPQIAALRDEFYRESGMERIPVPPAASWIVALANETVVAACAILEGELNGAVVYVTDFYCADARIGKLGAKRLLQYLESFDARVTGSSPVWNIDFLRVLTGRGWHAAEIRMEIDNRARAH